MTTNFTFEKDIILENSHVLLRPMESTDFDDFWRISMKDPGLLKYSPGQIDTRDKLETYINTALNLRTLKQKYSLTIIEKLQGKVIGSSSYMNISSENNRLEIGSTWLDPDTHGKGFNKQIKLPMLSYAFENLNYERVELKTDSRNIQSRKAILKIGAQYEGCLRSHTLMSDGYRRHSVYYSILKEEWPYVKEILSR